ncbi:MAG: iron ABC transporter permease [Defluviitaleaceae bacterium]|nr:iron ABC transporter permease [Defluviitaleaceae bacterium]
MKISPKIKIVFAIIASIMTLLMAVAIGSVYISPANVFLVILYNIFENLGINLAYFTSDTIFTNITAADNAIVWHLRFPRVLLAFAAGAALSVSGAIMQSVLRNPLASSFTLGVSSGASLGAAFVIFLGVSLPIFAVFTLPILGFLFGMLTILLVVGFSAKLQHGLENNTIILTGMVLSLFINAVTTLLFALFRENAQRMILWQMGSFSMQDWQTVFILAPIVAVGTAFIFRYKLELDILTFGEEQAQTIGVNSGQMKILLLIIAAALTGSTISFVGIIGFVDLVAPHVVRKIFGASHRYVIPMSGVIGGSFMVLADLVARTIIAPTELPVGVVTAILGAPFFAYVFFAKWEN